jgi:hypothetical protein
MWLNNMMSNIMSIKVQSMLCRRSGQSSVGLKKLCVRSVAECITQLVSMLCYAFDIV